jgi:hypothetical protein
MADKILEQATEAPKEFLHFLKKYWWAGPVIVLALLAVGMAIKPWFTRKMTGTEVGDKLPVALRNFLRIGVALLPFGVLLFAGDAVAATCCADLPTAGGVLGWLAERWEALISAIGMLGGSGLMLGLTQFGAPDVIDCEETHGGHSLAVGALAATTPQTLFAKTSTHSTAMNGKVPLVATDLTVEVACTIDNSAGASTLDDQDFARLLAYLEIVSPTMGNLTDQVSCTGPVLDLVTRFLGDAFERSGDAPVISIIALQVATAITKYFTRPWALRFMDRPLTTAPWLGFLHNLRINCGLAADTCLVPVSVGSTITGRTLRASISYLPVPDWYYPMVANDRVDQPASGSNGLTFQNFGGPGADCTEKVDYVHTIGHLSSLKGLGGNLTFDTLIQLLAPRFGLDNIEDIPHLVKARLRAQYMGRIGGVDYTGTGNYAIGTTNAPGMALAGLLFFFLQQPSLDMAVSAMRRMDKGQELPVQYVTSVPRVGADQFYFGAIRRVTSAFVAKARALPDSRMPSSIHRIRNGLSGVER